MRILFASDPPLVEWTGTSCPTRTVTNTSHYPVSVPLHATTHLPLRQEHDDRAHLRFDIWVRRSFKGIMLRNRSEPHIVG